MCGNHLGWLYKAGNWNNSPDLYHWRENVRVYDQDQPWMFCYWNAKCRDPWNSEGVKDIKVRVTETNGGGELMTFDEGGIRCTHDKLLNDEDFYNAANSCKSKKTPEMTLKAAIVH